jgi:hypothetical protein
VNSPTASVRRLLHPGTASAATTVEMSVWCSYLLVHTADWLLLIVLAWAAVRWLDLPVWIAVALLAAWIVKDLLLFPSQRHYYVTEPSERRIVGEEGEALSPVDPDGRGCTARSGRSRSGAARHELPRVHGCGFWTSTGCGCSSSRYTGTQVTRARDSFAWHTGQQWVRFAFDSSGSALQDSALSLERTMNENFTQRRSESNVCDRRPRRDVERWLTAMAAAACFAAGLRRRNSAGFWLAIAGGALAWRAAGVDRRDVGRATLHRLPATRQRTDEMVDEASQESFPASDAPALSAHPSRSPNRVSADPQTDRGRVVPTNPLPPPEPRT